MPYFTEPDEALDAIYDKINNARNELGLGYVGYADERLLPRYPACVVSFNAPVDRTIHALHQFRLNWSIQIIIYHARLSASHKVRSREDMQLAAAVRNKLHSDFTLGGGVIFGFVASERPGILADDKGNANIATALVWTAESRAIF